MKSYDRKQNLVPNQYYLKICHTLIEDQCGNASDIQQCIVEGTYNLSSVVKDAHIGFETKESLMNSSLWHEDFTGPWAGRYFTMNPGRMVTPNWATDQIFLHLHESRNYTIFIYNSNFFVLNMNFLSFPVIIKEVSSSMGSHYWNIAVVERRELNHPKDPCYDGSLFFPKSRISVFLQVLVTILEDV